MSRSQPAARLEEVEQRLFARYGVTPRAFDVTLADPALRVRVLESEDGPPLLLVHGSGTSASTWAPLLPHLPGRRLLAVDLPGFGLNDAHDYSWRPLRTHAVAQMRSIVDALGLARVAVVGTSLGGWWALSLALAEPERVSAVATLGTPALAFGRPRRGVLHRHDHARPRSARGADAATGDSDAARVDEARGAGPASRGANARRVVRGGARNDEHAGIDRKSVV